MYTRSVRRLSLFAFIVIMVMIFGFSWLGYNLFLSFSDHEEFIDYKKYDVKILKDKNNIIPVAIIGSGPAGLSAALYGARGGFMTVVFEGPQPGGQLMTTSWVENWPGMPKKMGPDLIQSSREQAQEFGASLVSRSVKKIDVNSWPFAITLDNNQEVNALTLIIATGAHARRLDIPGENEYWGKGVTTCAICDAPFYKDLEVFVVGGGDSAAEEAMQLASYARKVTLIVRGSSMRASAVMQERLKSYKNITIQYDSALVQVKGNGSHVTHADIKIGQSLSTVRVDGIFLAIGHEPNSELVRGQVAMDRDGYIFLKGHSQKTSISGVYAAGDVEDRLYRQAGIAAGEGIKAALDAADFLRGVGYNDAFASTIESCLFNEVLGGPERLALQELHSLQELEEKIKQAHDAPMLLDFYTEICPSCMQMLPALESLAYKLKGRMEFYKIDAMKSAKLAEKFAIESVPTVLIIKNGVVVAQAHSAMSSDILDKFVHQAIS